MPSIELDELTPFGRIAVKLDQELSELARLGEQLSQADIESDKGLAEGIKLLNRAAPYGQSVVQSMQELAQRLDELRERAEAATGVVAGRAQLIQERRRLEDELQSRLQKLNEEVSAAGAALAAFNQPGKVLTDEDKRRVAEELGKMQAPMARFIEAGQAIKAEAARGNFRRLERQADSMIDSLKASLLKISQALPPKP